MDKTMQADKISKEKLEWLKEIGATEFKEPMKYHVGVNWLYSEKNIAETPLETLKAQYDERLISWGHEKELIDRMAVLETKVAKLIEEVKPSVEMFEEFKNYNRNSVRS